MADDHDLPPGFRFYPTEEELVSFYLHNKLKGTRPDLDRVIPVLDIYEYNPSDLPRLAGERCPADSEQWFFFIPRQEREVRGGRPNRLTSDGYWKATGSPGDVYSSQNRVIGRKRTMVFYVGRAPNGTKTQWKMNEYKAIDTDHHHPEASSSSSSTPTNLQLREELSLCRIYKRTKCLRAYDRRPPSEAALRGNQAAVHHQQYYHYNAATETISNDPVLAETTNSPLDSNSNSGEPTNINPNFHSVGSDQNNGDMASDIDNEPFWDWEQFNWFDL